MIQLNKHPILLQCYKLSQKIEEFPASELQTKAVTISSELLNELVKLVDQEETDLNC